jgi:hypothetical protein
MLGRLGRSLRRLKEWVEVDHGGVMDELITTTGFWIFASIAVMVAAGLLWGAMSGDIQALVGVLTNLF